MAARTSQHFINLYALVLARPGSGRCRQQGQEQPRNFPSVLVFATTGKVTPTQGGAKEQREDSLPG